MCAPGEISQCGIAHSFHIQLLPKVPAAIPRRRNRHICIGNKLEGYSISVGKTIYEIMSSIEDTSKSETIKGRSLEWFAFLLRQNEDISARKTLMEVERNVKKLKGGQKLTRERTRWIKFIDNDINRGHFANIIKMPMFVYHSKDLIQASLNLVFILTSNIHLRS